MKKKIVAFVVLFFLIVQYLFANETTEATIFQAIETEKELSTPTLPKELSPDELKALLPNLEKPFPIKEVDFTKLEEFSLFELRQYLPCLNEPFPYEVQVDEVFPDGYFAVDNELEAKTNYNPWLSLKALEQSYDEVKELSFDPTVNDWFILVNQKPFFWANGKILPIDAKDDEKHFTPFFTYEYTKRIFEISDKEIEYYTKLFSEQSEKIVSGEDQVANTLFLKEIYGTISEKEIKAKLKEVNFLGARVYVHEKVAQALQNVNTQLTLYKKSGLFKSFFSNYATTYGFNWRTIEYTTKLSNHSLGLAVDVMAKNYGKLNSYWYWESTVNDKWFLLKESDRWIPPTKVIEAFEAQGFIWGGYWTLWDTMHFEFKPELIFISNYIYSQNEYFYTNADITKMQELEEKRLKQEKANSEAKTEEALDQEHKESKNDQHSKQEN